MARGLTRKPLSSLAGSRSKLRKARDSLKNSYWSKLRWDIDEVESCERVRRHFSLRGRTMDG